MSLSSCRFALWRAVSISASLRAISPGVRTFGSGAKRPCTSARTAFRAPKTFQQPNHIDTGREWREDLHRGLFSFLVRPPRRSHCRTEALAPVPFQETAPPSVAVLSPSLPWAEGKGLLATAGDCTESISVSLASTLVWSCTTPQPTMHPHRLSREKGDHRTGVTGETSSVQREIEQLGRHVGELDRVDTRMDYMTCPGTRNTRRRPGQA